MKSKLKTQKLKINLIKASKILDSRGNPTLEVEAGAGGFSVKSSVPSGASTGKYEAKIIDTNQAIKNINEIIAPALIGKNPREQKEIDTLLLGLDGTENKSNVGGNAIAGVSMAICRLGAKTNQRTLYSHLKIKNGNKKKSKIILPKPCFNIINGGAHAKNELDIQEFMIVPQFEKFSENFSLAKEIYKKLGKIIKEKFGKTEIGDEGGFSPPISKAKEILELIKKASDNFKNIKIILDCAASQFQKGNKYKIEGKLLSRKELLIYYQELISQYPIIGLEDSFGEEDFEGWKLANVELKAKNEKLLIIGDDLTVTNPKRIKMAQKNNLCNGVIIKINQIGTVSEAVEAGKLAKKFGWKIMVSHRSGETLDDFIADFSVGIGADFIKSGAPVKPERLAKYNRLLEIEEEICSAS